MSHDICTLWKRLEMKVRNSSSTTRKDSIESLLVAVYFCLLLSFGTRGTSRPHSPLSLNVICSDWLASVTRDLSRYFSIRGHLQITRKFKIHVSEKLISLFFSNLSTVWCHSSLNCWVQHLEERFIKETSGHFSIVCQAGKLNWVFERREKVRKISRTVNSTAWPLHRNGSTNLVCTCFDNCMFIWFFWQSIKNFSGSHQRDILAAISTEIRFCLGEGKSTLNEQQALAFVIEFR